MSLCGRTEDICQAWTGGRAGQEYPQLFCSSVPPLPTGRAPSLILEQLGATQCMHEYGPKRKERAGCTPAYSLGLWRDGCLPLTPWNLGYGYPEWGTWSQSFFTQMKELLMASRAEPNSPLQQHGVGSGAVISSVLLDHCCSFTARIISLY